jgi:hypothetical protein
MKTIEQINREIAEISGLAEGGLDDEGNQLFIGTDKQWEAFEQHWDDEENNIMERPEIYK